MPKISDILRQKGGEVVTGRPEQTVAEAVETLIRHRIGCIMITGPDGAAEGIFTERDVLRLVAERPGDWRTVRIEDRMTRDLVCGVPDDDLDYVMATMTEGRFRRLPVIEDGKLVGIVSIGDVVKALKSATEYEVRQLRDYISGVYS